MSSNIQILEEVLSKTKELQKMIMFMRSIKICCNANICCVTFIA